MRSFIEHSKNFILGAVIIVVVYVLLALFVPRYDSAVNALQTNNLKAENFVLDKKHYKVVCIGSSEMHRVNVSDLSDEWYNLSFQGGGPMTGLELIKKYNLYPDNVVIEINDTLLRGADYTIVDSLDRKNIFNRIKYRPDFIFFSLYRPVADKVFSGREGRSVNEDLIQSQIEEHNKPLDENETIKAIEMLEAYVKDLDNHQVGVYFAWVPNDERLYDTVKFVELRNQLYESFPEGEYNWINCDWGDYQTQDGIHLCKESAEKYAEFLLSIIN